MQSQGRYGQTEHSKLQQNFPLFFIKMERFFLDRANMHTQAEESDASPVKSVRPIRRKCAVRLRRLQEPGLKRLSV